MSPAPGAGQSRRAGSAAPTTGAVVGAIAYPAALFDPPTCPACGSFPWGEMDTVVAELTDPGPDGHQEWSGKTNLDTQEPLTDRLGRVRLVCSGDDPHLWWARERRP